MRRVYEIAPDNVRAVHVNQKSRDQEARDSIDMVRTSDVIEGVKKRDDSLLLQGGEHGGGELSAFKSVMTGLPGAVMTKTLEVKNSGFISNVRFFTDGDDLLVNVSYNRATVFFMGCHFEKNAKKVATFVEIAAGARVHFIGCSFYPMVNVGGALFSHTGAITSVQVMSCSNTTGQTFGNCTDTATTT